MMYTHPHVGDGVYNVEQLGLCPTGTVLRETNNPSGNRFVKMADGRWQQIARRGRATAGSVYDPVNFSMAGYNSIESFPDDYVVPASDLMNVDKFLWLVRDTALVSQARNSVNYSSVEHALAKLDVSDPERFPLGPGVEVSNTYDRRRLPRDTVLSVGSPDRALRYYGVFVKSTPLGRDGGWTNVLGHLADAGYRSGTLLSVPGVEEPPVWWVRPGTEAEQEQIAQLRARVWRVGMRLKSDTGWCGEVEETMGRMGVDESATRRVRVHGFVIGETINGDEAQRLPVGSVLEWRHTSNPARWALYVRTDEVSNVARCRRLFASTEAATVAGNYASRMRVLWIPSDDDPMFLTSEHFGEYLLAAPPGTRISQRGGGREFVLHTDGRLSTYDDGVDLSRRGTYGFAEFGEPQNLGFVHFAAEGAS